MKNYLLKVVLLEELSGLLGGSPVPFRTSLRAFVPPPVVSQALYAAAAAPPLPGLVEMGSGDLHLSLAELEGFRSYLGVVGVGETPRFLSGTQSFWWQRVIIWGWERCGKVSFCIVQQRFNF